MPLSLIRQILEEHLADGELTPGRPISIRMDQALLQDATGTMALMQFKRTPRARRVGPGRSTRVAGAARGPLAGLSTSSIHPIPVPDDGSLGPRRRPNAR
jgi:hypothetical protein